MIKKNNLKGIIFDLGNVLIDVRWDLCLERLREKNPRIDIQFQNFFRDKLELFQNFEMGKISDEIFLSEIRDYIGSDLDTNALARNISDIFVEKTAITSKLNKLSQNYKIYMLSNTSSMHKKFGWGDYDFLKYFDRLFLSYEIGLIKPMNEIYEFVEKEICLNYDEFIYFDDIKEYIEGAKNRGWNAIHVTSEQNLIKALNENFSGMD